MNTEMGSNFHGYHSLSFYVCPYVMHKNCAIDLKSQDDLKDQTDLNYWISENFQKLDKSTI